MVLIESNTALLASESARQMSIERAGGYTSDGTLSNLYWQWFETHPSRTPQLLDTAFRLRYGVYCIENAFEDRTAYADGREWDEFDQRSAHSLLIYRPTGTPAGTVRLVLPLRADLQNSFALQRVCRHPFVNDRSMFPIERMAEVSRFCISKEFRRRWDDGTGIGSEMSAEEERRILPHLSLGLIESLIRMSIDHHVTHWCAVMEPALLRLLARLGIHFKPIGPLIEYHGRRQPCYISLDVLLPRMRRERPDVWDLVTRGGRHWFDLRRLSAEK